MLGADAIYGYVLKYTYGYIDIHSILHHHYIATPTLTKHKLNTHDSYIMVRPDQDREIHDMSEMHSKLLDEYNINTTKER